jgi:hypothetical protein
MTESANGAAALMIPALPNNSELIEVPIRPAARDHLRGGHLLDVRRRRPARATGR